MEKKERINNYFPHDSNARNSDKLIRLRMRHKSAGYGVFFMILERLREEPEYMSIKDYNMIAFDLREDALLIKSVIEDFGLFVFTEDGKYFYSESFKRRMEIKDDKSRKRSEAGKKGMISRWENKDVITNDINIDNNVITNDTETITRKEKERKEKNNPLLSPDGDIFPGENSSEKKDDNPVDLNQQNSKKEKSPAKKERNSELTFPYTSEEFVHAWQNLMCCPKWKKKNHYTLQLALNKLAKFEEEYAIILIESAAANNWQGVVFPDTEEKYLKWRKAKNTKPNISNHDNNQTYTKF